MKTITAKELKKMLDKKQMFYFINVLSNEKYNKKHIPNSINIPVESENFKEIILETIDNKDSLIVVYCWSFECQASPRAGEILEHLGYTNVFDFEGGVEEWEEKGFELIERKKEIN